ncbi:MAG: polysaccharide biosynthesis protein [Chloroflexi bacterium]|nr:polysaccharide biosynthesis protein [Chloroflexota bacterium]
MPLLDPTRLDPATLLGRDELPLDWSVAKRELAGARVLVTGAGGSVGARLAEMLLDLGPAHLTLLDHHDHALFALRRRLDDLTRDRTDAPTWSLALADIRDSARLTRVFDAARPDVIFHMAAYKHVPFGEEFPEETFGVNVLATDQILKLAVRRGVTRLVYPSSDKAVNPPSLYGATKRLSETLVGVAAATAGRQFVAIRYVNILGTHGSAIETFAAQVAEGQALTITDQAMTRYWISMPEAVWLVVQAAVLGKPGSVMMLDVPDEVPILDIARRVERLVAPDGEPLPIRVTGLRPGERLREELLSEHETFESGPCGGLLEVVNLRREENLASVTDHVERLRRLAEDGDGPRLKAAAMSAARELQ